MSSLNAQYYNLSQFGLAPILIEWEEHKNMLI